MHDQTYHKMFEFVSHERFSVLCDNKIKNIVPDAKRNNAMILFSHILSHILNCDYCEFLRNPDADYENIVQVLGKIGPNNEKWF